MLYGFKLIFKTVVLGNHLQIYLSTNLSIDHFYIVGLFPVCRLSVLEKQVTNNPGDRFFQYCLSVSWEPVPCDTKTRRVTSLLSKHYKFNLLNLEQIVHFINQAKLSFIFAISFLLCDKAPFQSEIKQILLKLIFFSQSEFSIHLAEVHELHEQFVNFTISS